MSEKRVLEVVETATGNVVREIDVSNRGARQTEKIEDGVNRNLNHEAYFTRLVPGLPPEKKGIDR
jgi:hypothetical protein